MRERVASGLLQQRAKLVARIRRQLAVTGAPASAADDVFSTTVRRADSLAAAGRLLADITDSQLLALATAISYRASHEASRESKRERRRAGAAAEALQTHEPARAPVGQDPDLDRLLRRLTDRDLEILGLRLRGADWSVIAEQLEMTPAGAHRRFYRAMQSMSDVTSPQG